MRLFFEVASNIVLFLTCFFVLVFMHDLFYGGVTTIAEGSAYGFEIGESKKAVWSKIEKLSESGKISKISINVSGNAVERDVDILGKYFNNWYVEFDATHAKLNFEMDQLSGYRSVQVDIDLGWDLALGSSREEVAAFLKSIKKKDEMMFSFYNVDYRNIDDYFLSNSSNSWRINYDSIRHRDSVSFLFSGDNESLYKIKRNAYFFPNTR